MSQFKEIKPEELNDNTFKMIGKDWMLITASKGDLVNTMTASWGGLGVIWNRNVAYVFIRPQRYTKEFVDASDTFSLTFYGKEYKEQLSYLGCVSGRDEDKIAKAELTVTRELGTPYFEEAKIVLICKKLFAQPLEESSFLQPGLAEKFYPEKDYHTMYVAEIVKVLVDESCQN
ncbi:MAG TPA: flavin reductase family protein [Lachnospiraceae bacterium]|nr:flavin reductase family protein [Lachnospiraceae bacterium]